MAKQMDAELYAVEVLEAVRGVFQGEAAARRLRELLGWNGHELVEALRRPPFLCDGCNKILPSSLHDLCGACRQKAEAEAKDKEVRQRVELALLAREEAGR